MRLMDIVRSFYLNCVSHKIKARPDKPQARISTSAGHLQNFRMTSLVSRGCSLIICFDCDGRLNSTVPAVQCSVNLPGSGVRISENKITPSG